MLIIQPVERRLSRFFGKILPEVRRWRFRQKPIGLDLDGRKAKRLLLHITFFRAKKLPIRIYTRRVTHKIRFAVQQCSRKFVHILTVSQIQLHF